MIRAINKLQTTPVGPLRGAKMPAAQQ